MSKVNANTKANVERSKKSQIKTLEVALLNYEIMEKELQCWLRTGHLPFFRPHQGHLAAQVSPSGAPVPVRGNNNKKMLMPGRHQSRAYSFGISYFFLDICLGITQIYCLFILTLACVQTSPPIFPAGRGSVHRRLQLWPAGVTIGNLDKMADER